MLQSFCVFSLCNRHMCSQLLKYSINEIISFTLISKIYKMLIAEVNVASHVLLYMKPFRRLCAIYFLYLDYFLSMMDWMIGCGKI
jgi:hypothetical protein